MIYTPKRRMLNAYRGVFSDRPPVAPEFWYYYPAKVLGVDMIQFEREVPLWQALQTTFKKFGTEGWGIDFPQIEFPEVDRTSSFTQLSDHQFQRRTETTFQGRTFTTIQLYDRDAPSWVVEYPCKDEKDVGLFLDMLLSPRTRFGFESAQRAHAAVGEDYLLELWLGMPFFDFIAGFFGFEKALYYVVGEDPLVLAGYQKRYIDFQVELVRQACVRTSFESFCIGCAYSCNSLIGPSLWRQWDKPYIQAVADEIHRQGRLLHVHFHGKCLETVADFAEMGIDCVCPFERPPGGDVEGWAGLQVVRSLLNGRVTMNGNVHTVETLIRGTPERVRHEVRQIRQAFAGCPRLIIGTGDQVGRETPEENIAAMIEEAQACYNGHPTLPQSSSSGRR